MKEEGIKDKSNGS